MNIKKNIILSLIILLGSTTLQAQYLQKYGFKIGISISNIELTDVKPAYVDGQPRNLDFIEGYVVNPSLSIFADLLSFDYLDLQLDLTYLRKGASESYDVHVTTDDNPNGPGTLKTFTSECSLQYLDFAIIAQPKYCIGDFCIYAQLGTTANYLLTISNLAPLSDVNRFQLGYIVGLGIDLSRLLNSQLFIEIRYSGDFNYFK